MKQAVPDSRTVIVERDLAHSPQKIWCALTEQHLLQEWLMKSDFALALGHSFRFTADWGGVDCTIKAIEPGRTLAYSWNAYGLESVVNLDADANGNGDASAHGAERLPAGSKLGLPWRPAGMATIFRST